MRDRIIDRRGQQRRHLLYYLDVFDNVSGKLLGQLGDITTDGLLLISSAPLQIKEDGEEREMKVKLPENRGFGSDYLEMKVKACWTSPDFNPDLFCTGFQFLNPDEKMQQVVGRLIKILGFRE